MVAWVAEWAAERSALSLVSPLASEASSTMTPPVRAAFASDFCCLAALRSALRRRSVSSDAGDVELHHASAVLPRGTTRSDHHGRHTLHGRATVGRTFVGRFARSSI